MITAKEARQRALYVSSVLTETYDREVADTLEVHEKRIAELDAKWRDYETNYILPTFKWAEEMKIDLHALVAAGGGNCVELFFRELRKRIEELEESLEEARYSAMGEDL